MLSDRQEDLLRRDADIAVRMARPTQGALTARRIGAVPVGLFAHRRYLQRHGEPTSLDQAGVAAIGFDRNVEMLSALEALDIRLDREMFALALPTATWRRWPRCAPASASAPASTASPGATRTSCRC